MTAPIFRIHFENGATLDIAAESPDQARRNAKHAAARFGPIVKVKRLREKENA